MGRKQAISLLLAGMLASAGMSAQGSPFSMKGPPRSGEPIHPQDEESQPATAVQNALLKAIDFYRSFISPTQGGRCGFYPSCSTFGSHAVHQFGALQGGMMTADRLTRCNIFKQPGVDYYLRPDGRLYDPVAANLLQEQ